MPGKKKNHKPNRKALWLKNFFNDSNPATFLNKTESAAQANYKNTSRQYLSEVGTRNASFYKDIIVSWLDEVALSDEALKLKLKALLNAEETKFFQKDGKITDQINVEALEIQRRSLDMAFKVKGIYAPEKREHTLSESMMAIIAKLRHQEKHGGTSD